ncbi:DUF4238 domain-containing protein [Brevundimonas sp. Marseille-Q4549]|jgi:hypothetical protein
MTSSNPPRKHHFAPVFYLNRWTGPDGRLEQYDRPFGDAVKRRRVFPAGTGYEDGLYSMPGLSPDLMQQVEERFMQQVDHQAAGVLALLERGQFPQTSGTRSAWSRFIQSLQLRTPADIAGIKARTRADWIVNQPEIQAAYEEMVRQDGDPATFEDFMTARDPEIVERVAMQIATVLIDNPTMGEFINNMRWAVVDLAASSLSLQVSDWCVEQVSGLRDPEAFIHLPIGPKRLFVAANDQGTIDALRRAPPRELVKRRNHTTVALARRYVWAADRRQEAFIHANFGSVTRPTLGERLADLGATGA